MASECPLWVTSGHDGGEFEISALPAKADIVQRGGNVRLVQKWTPAAAAKASLSVTQSPAGTLAAAGGSERHGSLWALTLRSRACVGPTQRETLSAPGREPAPAGNGL